MIKEISFSYLTFDIVISLYSLVIVIPPLNKIVDIFTLSSILWLIIQFKYDFYGIAIRILPFQLVLIYDLFPNFK